MRDCNEIVSRADRKLVFDGTPASLKNLTFGGVRRRYYVGLEQAMLANIINRTDAPTEVVNIRHIIAGQIEVTSLPGSMLNYFIKSMNLENQLFVSPRPLLFYSRHIMVTKSLEAEHDFLVKQVLALANNIAWQASLEKYGL